MNLIEKQIQEELSKLDPDLFLDKELFEGSIYPVVRYRAGEEIFNVATHPYFSMEIVDKVKQQEGDIISAIAQIKANNAIKKEEAKLNAVKEQEAISHEWQWENRGGKTIFHSKS